MLVNLTFNPKYTEDNEKELNNMKYLSEKYKDKDFTAIGQFSYDIGIGEKFSNREIAH